MTERETLTPDYFDEVYKNSDDPWNFETSEYEAAKYAATLNVLPRATYRNAFEIGCSIGVLTEQLAANCKSLLAVDVSEKALAQAKKRCANLPNVRLKRMEVPKEFPDEMFDLILISEVGYYLSETDWRLAIEKVFKNLRDKGHIILTHWTPFVDDYPQTGDAVHDSFAAFAEGKMRNLRSDRTEKYRLDVWEKI